MVHHFAWTPERRLMRVSVSIHSMRQVHLSPLNRWANGGREKVSHVPTSAHATSPASLQWRGHICGSLPRVRHDARCWETGEMGREEGAGVKSQVGRLQQSQPCKYTPPHFPVSPELVLQKIPTLTGPLPRATPGQGSLMFVLK